MESLVVKFDKPADVGADSGLAFEIVPVRLAISSRRPLFLGWTSGHNLLRENLGARPANSKLDDSRLVK